MTVLDPVPPAWRAALSAQAAALVAIDAHLVTARAAGAAIAPTGGDIFRALALTPPEAVRAVLLGQDPYPTRGHADGLCFSVRPGVAPPRSLRNIFRELEADLGLPAPSHGNLEPWARQGVLLLNTVLTVEEGAANAHAGWGWEPVTDAVIDAVSANADCTVFLLWGGAARAKAKRIPPRHAIVSSAHPSPLSAHAGFFGSRPFSRANAALAAAGRGAIDWRLPPAGATVAAPPIGG